MLVDLLGILISSTVRIIFNVYLNIKTTCNSNFFLFGILFKGKRTIVETLFDIAKYYFLNADREIKKNGRIVRLITIM